MLPGDAVRLEESAACLYGLRLGVDGAAAKLREERAIGVEEPSARFGVDGRSMLYVVVLSGRTDDVAGSDWQWSSSGVVGPSLVAPVGR